MSGSFHGHLMNYSKNESNEDTSINMAKYICTHPSSSIQPFIDLRCEEFPITHSLPVQILVATGFTLLIITALIGNAVVMWIIIYSKVMRRSFNFFLFNMAFADFLMALLNAGSTWSYNLYYDWWFGRFCSVNNFFGVAPTCVSVFTMMVISWDRCAAVVSPLRKRQLGKRCTILTILGIWMLASIIALPVALPARISKNYFYSIPKKQLQVHTICHNEFKYKYLYEYFLFAVQYVIPLIVLALMYGKIIRTFRRNSLFANLDVTQAPQQMRAKRKVIKMLGSIVLIFMICWLPYQMYHLFLARYLIASYSYILFYWMAMSACAYNPIIYCYFNVRFRVGFRYAFRWIPCINFQEEEEKGHLFPQPVFNNTKTSHALTHTDSTDFTKRLQKQKRIQKNETTLNRSHTFDS